MNEITCFDLDMDGSMEPSENGQWVRAEDCGAAIHKLFQSEKSLQEMLRVAIWRIEDMLKGDDGQAFKEAERFLPQARKLLEVQA